MDFVNWPTDWDVWRDSGEGGLFAYVVWGTVDGSWVAGSKHCNIDVKPQIPIGDVLVSALGPLKDEFKDQGREFSELTREYTEQGYALASLEVQVEVSTAVFLGSTRSSLHNAGDYFSVGADDLTDEGKALVAALTAAYGEPTFLTYLDT